MIRDLPPECLLNKEWARHVRRERGYPEPFPPEFLNRLLHELRWNREFREAYLAIVNGDWE